MDHLRTKSTKSQIFLPPRKFMNRSRNLSNNSIKENKDQNLLAPNSQTKYSKWKPGAAHLRYPSPVFCPSAIIYKNLHPISSSHPNNRRNLHRFFVYRINGIITWTAVPEIFCKIVDKKIFHRKIPEHHLFSWYKSWSFKFYQIFNRFFVELSLKRELATGIGSGRTCLNRQILSLAWIKHVTPRYAPANPKLSIPKFSFFRDRKSARVQRKEKTTAVIRKIF